MMSISIVSIGSISGGLGISGPLAIVVSMVGIWVSIVSMVGISISMVGKSVSVSVESISLGLSSSSGLGISRPLAIVVAIVVGIWVSIVSIVTIEKTSISRCISLASSSGEHAQGNNSLKKRKVLRKPSLNEKHEIQMIVCSNLDRKFH